MAIIKPLPFGVTSINDSFNLAIQKKKFGFFSDSVFFLQSETEVKKISLHFKSLVENRIHSDFVTTRQREQELTKIKFEPKINRKSEMIVGKKLENIYTKVFGANRQSKNGSVSFSKNKNNHP